MWIVMIARRRRTGSLSCLSGRLFSISETVGRPEIIYVEYGADTRPVIPSCQSSCLLPLRLDKFRKTKHANAFLVIPMSSI